jgi:hypothetical protein
MTTQTTPTLEVAKIDGEEGFDDARTRQGADGLGRLPASISSPPENKAEVLL